jgi:hypothetical protein
VPAVKNVLSDMIIAIHGLQQNAVHLGNLCTKGRKDHIIIWNFAARGWSTQTFAEKGPGLVFIEELATSC